MSIRVIGGEFGGRKLESVPGFGTRPLLGQVREALFNILAPQIEGALIWDLFAGTGASGIEALSRGARAVVFVEKSGRALRVLRANLELVDPEGELAVEVVRGNAWDPPIGEVQAENASDHPGSDIVIPDTASPDTASPDIVFFDPPYPDVRLDPTLALARLRALIARCAPGGCVVFHFPDGLLDEDDLGPLGELDLRSWGQAAVAIIRRPVD